MVGVNPTVIEILDRRDPFLSGPGRPTLSEDELQALAAIADIEEELVAVAADPEQPLPRRFAAASAMFQGGWTDWRDGPAGAAIAAALAAAIREDHSHNRWGLPGVFVGPSGADLLHIDVGVDEALTPLLDDQRELVIEGSEAAARAEREHFRIADLAAYLIAKHRGEE